MKKQRSINIWYVCGLSLCNFDCPYCASGIPSQGGGRTNDREWLTEEDSERYENILDWIGRQPYRIGLRLQTIGEPFVSRSFLKGATRISESPNIRFVELVTNGSLLSRRLPRLINDYGADPHKFSLWVTYHHTEISAQELVNQVSFARDLGVEVVVNSLVFPDNASDLRQLAQLCREQEIPLNVDIGYNYNNAYTGAPFFTMRDDKVAEVMRELNANAQIQLTAITAAVTPWGLQCSAGYDYVHITPDGELFPCRSYRGGGQKTRLGSALDKDFKLNLRKEEYSRCIFKKGCVCKEDYLHMRIARSSGRDHHSLGLGYSGTVPDREKKAMSQILKQIQSTELVRVLNSMTE